VLWCGSYHWKDSRLSCWHPAKPRPCQRLKAQYYTQERNDSEGEPGDPQQVKECNPAV